MMLNKKNIVLLLSFFLMLVIAYKFSISKTIAASKQYASINKQRELLSDIPSQISYLKQQNKFYEEVLAKNQISSESFFQNNLLKIVNTFAKENKLDITGFKEPHIIEQNDAVTKTYQFSVKGDYTSILKLLHTIEQYGNYGKIISTDFQKKKNYKTNKVFLECKVFLQRVERGSINN